MRRNKFGNKKRECKQGHEHASIKESLHCNDLALLQRAGEFKKYECEPEVILMEGFKGWDGKKIRDIKFKPDFVITHHNGLVEYQDVKPIDRKTGKVLSTPAFKLKWKLLQKQVAHDPMYKFTII